MKVKDLPLKERPRERLMEYGKENLSNEELLSIILKTGNGKLSVKEVSNNVLNYFNGINNLKDATKEQLQQIKGIGLVQALTLLSVVELGKRIYMNDNISDKLLLTSSNSIYNYMKYQLYDKKQEYFYCLYVNQRKELIERKLLFMGTLNRSVVHPREVFKNAYLCSASGIICVHNHPSGNVNPSREDIRLTNSLVELGQVNGIPIIDHVIIGDNDYYSFYEDGKIINL
ncbi:MAG: DNA repair protein RadC [Tenericutes bacterium]|nr:DNA repair protein RadC [Mycoplasmatota bacterium]